MTTSLKNLAKLKKAERAQTTKIDHPLARYNNVGQLMCILCKAPVKSDALWPTHCASVAHKNSLIALQKQQAEQKQQAAQQPKRKRDEEEEQELLQKKLKFDAKQSLNESPSLLFSQGNTFTNNNSNSMMVESNSTNAASSTAQQSKVVQNEIPEGFFDDSVQQAQANAVSTLRQVTMQQSTYLSERDIEEESALIEMQRRRQAKLQQQQQHVAMDSDVEEDEVGLDDIVEVQDFSLFAFEDIDRIIAEPMKLEKKAEPFVVETYAHKQVEEEYDYTQEKIEGEMMRDILARRETFEKMRELKAQHEETKSSVISSVMDEKKREKRERKKNRKKAESEMDEDEVNLDAFAGDFGWRSQGLS